MASATHRVAVNIQVKIDLNVAAIIKALALLVLALMF